jgi:hypothetical protein
MAIAVIPCVNTKTSSNIFICVLALEKLDASELAIIVSFGSPCVVTNVPHCLFINFALIKLNTN